MSLVPQGNDRIKAFRDSHDPAKLSELLEELGLTLRAELEVLKEAMAKESKIGVRLAAQRQLRSLLRDIRMASTVLLQMTKSEDGQVNHSMIAPAFLEDIKKRNTNALEDKKEHGSPFKYLPPTAGQLDGDPRNAVEFGAAGIEAALRKAIRPRALEPIDVDVLGAGDEDAGCSGVPDSGSGLPATGGAGP